MIKNVLAYTIFSLLLGYTIYFIVDNQISPEKEKVPCVMTSKNISCTPVWRDTLQYKCVVNYDINNNNNTKNYSIIVDSMYEYYDSLIIGKKYMCNYHESLIIPKNVYNIYLDYIFSVYMFIQIPTMISCIFLYIYEWVSINNMSATSNVMLIIFLNLMSYYGFYGILLIMGHEFFGKKSVLYINKNIDPYSTNNLNGKFNEYCGNIIFVGFIPVITSCLVTAKFMGTRFDNDNNNIEMPNLDYVINNTDEKKTSNNINQDWINQDTFVTVFNDDETYKNMVMNDLNKRFRFNEINNIKKIINNNDPHCVICLDDTIRPILSECNHKYCSTCIVRWFGNSNNNTCTICRENIKIFYYV